MENDPILNTFLLLGLTVSSYGLFIYSVDKLGLIIPVYSLVSLLVVSLISTFLLSILSIIESIKTIPIIRQKIKNRKRLYK